MLVKTFIFFFLFFFFWLLYLESGFLSVAYLAVANLARLGISVHCQASVRSQCLVRLLSQCWITGGRTVHPPIEGLLPPTGTEPKPFRNSASKVAGLQVHITTPGSFLQPTYSYLILYILKKYQIGLYSQNVFKILANLSLHCLNQIHINFC